MSALEVEKTEPRKAPRQVVADRDRLAPGGDLHLAGTTNILHERMCLYGSPVELDGRLYVGVGMDFRKVETPHGEERRYHVHAYELQRPGGYGGEMKTIRQINPIESYEGLLVYWRDEPYVLTRPVEIVPCDCNERDEKDTDR